MDPETIGCDYTEFPKDFGYLRLKCGKAAFARLKDLVCAEAKLTDIDASKVRMLTIEDYHPNTPPRKTSAANVVVGIGCGLALGLLLGAAGIRIHTVWRAVMGP